MRHERNGLRERESALQGWEGVELMTVVEWCMSGANGEKPVGEGRDGQMILILHRSSSSFSSCRYDMSPARQIFSSLLSEHDKFCIMNYVEFTKRREEHLTVERNTRAEQWRPDDNQLLNKFLCVHFA